MCVLQEQKADLLTDQGELTDFVGYYQKDSKER